MQNHKARGAKQIISARLFSQEDANFSDEISGLTKLLFNWSSVAEANLLYFAKQKFFSSS